MSQDLRIPDKYLDITKLVTDYRGCIFGGAIRDFIRGDIPKDLDISIQESQEFYDKLLSLGYQSQENNHKMMASHRPFASQTIYSKDNIIIEICGLDDDSDLLVDINVSPDFDVNTLAYDGVKLFNFWNPYFNITSTLENIKNKRAKKINPTEGRIKKMMEKGWEIY